jgi:hypothetical protein
MMDLKYIVIEYHSHGQPFVFSPLITHKDMAAHAVSILHRSLGCDLADLKLVSAGFVQLLTDGPGVNTYGDSQSLHLVSRPEDASLLETYKL